LTETILDVATSLFLEQGYAATSLEAIASTAGVGKHTLYRRFSDKAALFAAVIRRRGVVVKAIAEASDTRPPLQRLRTLAATMLDRAMHPQSVRFVRVVIAEGHRFPELAEQFREHGARLVVVAASALIREAQAAGALEPGDPDWLAQSFIHVTVGMPLQHLLMGSTEYVDPAVLAEHLDRAWRLFMDGAGPPEGGC